MTAHWMPVFRLFPACSAIRADIGGASGASQVPGQCEEGEHGSASSL